MVEEKLARQQRFRPLTEEDIENITGGLGSSREKKGTFTDVGIDRGGHLGCLIHQVPLSAPGGREGRRPLCLKCFHPDGTPK